LIRSNDLPKLPDYLPRPLPPDADAELQRRLQASHSVYALALLLMRRTGLRIGELRSLPRRCVQNDRRGNQFLKVPLGKLANERLVPIDGRTAKLLRKLQRMGRSRRTLLIEGRPGSPANYERLRQALLSACRGLSLQDRMTNHRLRHTYATSLLAGGMSLLGVMKLLGHRDYRMTLRYTAISDETIAIEYDKALIRTLDQYQNPPLADPYTSSPLQLLDDVTRLIRRAAADFTLDPATAKAFQKRLRRLHASLDKALRTKSH
jgi:integrase